MTSDATLAAAREVATVLERHGADTAVIGALAVAAHGYPRATVDLDLATHVDPYRVLKAVDAELRGLGYVTELREPDAQDPLGGVLVVTRDGIDPIEVVNYLNPWGGGTALGAEAIAASRDEIEGTGLKVVGLAHLIALKLYAGGRKSQLDVLELLDRNPGFDLEGLREICDRHRLRPELEEVLGRRGP